MNFSKLNVDVTALVKNFLLPRCERSFVQAFPDCYFYGRTTAQLLEEVDAKQEKLDKELNDVLERLYTVEYTKEDAAKMLALIEYGANVPTVKDCKYERIIPNYRECENYDDFDDNAEKYTRINDKSMITVYSPLVIAIQHGDSEMVNKLIPHCDLNAPWMERGRYRDTPITMAVYEYQNDILQNLIDAGADVNKRYEYGCTALTYALYIAPIDTAHLLINAGCKADALCAPHYNPLALACQFNKYECVKALLERGARVDTLRYNTVRNLVINGQIETLEIICAAGMDINPECNNEGTALHDAARHASTTYRNTPYYGHRSTPVSRYIECARILCHYGANVHAVDAEGKTPSELSDNEEFKMLMAKYA